jgi:hypothetical protein
MLAAILPDCERSALVARTARLVVHAGSVRCPASPSASPGLPPIQLKTVRTTASSRFPARKSTVMRVADLDVRPDRIMLDTNVLLAATDEGSAEHHDALTIINAWAGGDTTLCASG